MKPTFEKIDPTVGSSFSIKKFKIERPANLPFWHFHPEYELVYISNGRGKRHIGRHISYYEDGDLVLLGPNIPHLAFCDDLSEGHVEIVVQIKEDFLGPSFLKRPELTPIRQVLDRARKGISFSGETKERIGSQLNDMLQQDPFERLISLLQVLHYLSESKDFRSLNAEGVAVAINPREQNRIRVIYKFVEQNFKDTITLETIAGEVNMTVPSFCRYFKKLTQKTFTQFVNEYRINYACRLLEEEDRSISEVCLDSGFQNFSHFNKQFKSITQKTPTEYRKDLKQLIEP